jgi:putative glutamine amidotransferase
MVDITLTKATIMQKTQNDKKPLVGISTCTGYIDDGRIFYKTNGEYIKAVTHYANAVPILIPSIGDDLDKSALLNRLDGLLFTGSPSNVWPDIYGGHAPREGNISDERRDKTTLPLLNLALDKGLPILCICRGHQELNVALGGTLHQHVHELPGKHDHREDKNIPLDENFKHRHPMRILENSLLADIAQKANIDIEKPQMINSLHSQAIDRLADGLMVNAYSDDEVIEAVSMPSAKNFLLALQWHPEHPHALKDALNREIFKEFRRAM